MNARRLLISLLNSGSSLRSFSILRMLWITVVWCFPPNFLPISGREELVSSLARYMAIWRGNETFGELFFDLSCEGLILNLWQTSFCIFSTVTIVEDESRRPLRASLVRS